MHLFSASAKDLGAKDNEQDIIKRLNELSGIKKDTVDKADVAAVVSPLSDANRVSAGEHLREPMMTGTSRPSLSYCE